MKPTKQRTAGLALCLCLSAGLLPRGAAAEERIQPDLLGFRTHSGRALPILQHQPYLQARRLWLAGFITTMSGLGVLTIGATALIIGTAGRDSLSEQGRGQAILTGGVLGSVGALGAFGGGLLWHLGRRDLKGLEQGLPLAPAVALSRDGGALALSGRF